MPAVLHAVVERGRDIGAPYGVVLDQEGDEVTGRREAPAPRRAGGTGGSEGTPTGTTFTVESLTRHKTYYFRVRAIDTSGNIGPFQRQRFHTHP